MIKQETRETKSRINNIKKRETKRKEKETRIATCVRSS